MPHRIRGRMALRAISLALTAGIACLTSSTGCSSAISTDVATIEADPLETPDGPPWFEDVTDKVGLKFVHDPGPNVEKRSLYQSLGSGCAMADLDGDGRPDLILLTGAGPNSKSTNALYRQKPDGTFEDVSRGSGLDFAGLNVGVAIGDVDNDGKPDVLITQAHGIKLFINKGGMKFEDVTADSGLVNPQWGTSAAFLDYDRDGWLDLIVVNYVHYDPACTCHTPTGELTYCAPTGFLGAASKLFRNRGRELAKDSNPNKPRVAFEDATVKSLIGSKPGPGLGVAVADFDGDGWPDILIANDGAPNHLFMNKKDGTFAEEALSRGIARTAMGNAYAGMGIGVGDIDNDGLLDVYVTHLSTETNTLWKQGPRGQFRDMTGVWGLMTTRWRGTGFGAVMADFDCDGWVDIAIVNGRIYQEPNPVKKPGIAPEWQAFAERNQLFANAGGGKFEDVSHNSPGLCGYYTMGRGLACGDFDGDGAPDLLVTAIGEKARLLRNVAPKRGHWLAVKAYDPTLSRAAIGAEILVRSGGIRRVRLLGSGDSYLSAGPLVAHFGLGASAAVDDIQVVWPDGSRESFEGGAANRTIELKKGSGKKL